MIHATRSQEEVFLALTRLKHTSFYNIMDVITINGVIDPERLSRAFRSAVEETNTLNVKLAHREGKIQLIQKDISNAFAFIDVSSFDNPQEEADNIIDQCIHDDFNIVEDTLCKFVLIKLTPNTWRLAEYCNHILMDGWGHSLVYSRIVDIYNGMSDEASTMLGQQQTLIACETEYANSPSYNKDKAYWQQYCASLPAPLRLSTEEKAADSLLRFRARLVGPLEQRLRRFAEARQLRLSSLLLSMFGIFIGKLSGEPRFTIGMPVAARKDKATRNVPGMMANILPLEIVTGPDDTLDDVTRHIGRTLRKHLIHQNYRYEDMVRDRAREGAYGALFHMTLNVVAYDQNAAFEGCEVAFQNVANGYTSDLSIDVFDRNADDSLEVGLNANGSLYTQEHLAQYYDRFLMMIERLMDNPEHPLRTLSLLSDDEYHAIQTRAERPAPTFSHVNEQFESVVQAHAERIAITAGEHSVTYEALAQRVDAVAAELKATGVSEGDRVGVMLPRGIDWIVCLLALYRLGATYLPINEDLPESRIQYMLNDADVHTLIVGAAGDSAAFDTRTAEWVVPTTLTGRGLTHQAVSLTPNTGAYIIYTSGSTGQPKGVLVPHQGIVDEVRAMQKATGIQPGDRLMQSSASSFDVSCLEVMLGLLSGAQLVIADTRIMAGKSDHLAAFINEQKITHLFLTPSVLAAHPSETLPKDVTLILTGEAAPRTLLERFAHCKRTLNLYGPSEATVVTINDHFSPTDLSLGATIDSMRTYVLDPQKQLMPPGSIGELYVAGTGLALGYLNMPEMTASRFVPDLFMPDEKMYATGDLVYQALDGRLTYCRRRDDQIKLRGLRIELGEVHNALLQHPDIAEAHVAVDTHPTHGPSLTGYVRVQSPVTPHDIKTQLRRTLPPYMVPSVIHILETLPLNASGKLDKSRLNAMLPQPSANADTDPNKKVTATEAVICAIFASVLDHKEPIASDQDFFMLGGHSLLAFQVLQQVKEAFGVELSIADFIASPTPGDVVRMIFDDHQYDSFAPVLRLRSGKQDTPIFCFHPAGGIGWPYAGLLKYFPAEWPLYVLQSPSLKDNDYLPATLDTLAADYIQRLREVQPNGPYHLIGWSFGGHIAHTIAAMLQAAGERVETLIMIDNYPRPSTKFQATDSIILSRLAQAVLNKKAEDISDWDGDLSNAMGLPKTQQKILETVVREFKTALGIMQSCTFQHYTGDMLFIRAKDDELRDADQVPEMWSPHISGDIVVKEVGFTHEAIMQTQALPSFAPDLTHYLKTRIETLRPSA